ncbi:hypothetical protein Acid7E03_12010 [Acidisoma sp. 7E03]
MGKAAIDGAEADAGLLGDLPHGRIHARPREDDFGGLQQSILAALGVGAQAGLGRRMRRVGCHRFRHAPPT